MSAPAARRRGTVCCADAAVGGEEGLAVAGGPHQRPRRAEPPGGRVRKALALHADGGAEQGHEGNLADEGRERLDRGFEAEHHAGLGAEVAGKADGPQAGLAILGVHADEPRPGLDERLGLRLDDCGLDHQMDVDRTAGQRGEPGDEIGEEQEGRREDAVGDVDVQEVGVRLDAGEVALEIGEVGRPERELSEQPVARQVGEGAHAGGPRRGDRREEVADRGPYLAGGADRIVGLGMDLDVARTRQRGGELTRKIERVQHVATGPDDQRGPLEGRDLGDGHAGAAAAGDVAEDRGEGGGLGAREVAHQRVEVVGCLLGQPRRRSGMLERAAGGVGGKRLDEVRDLTDRLELGGGTEAPGRAHQDQACHAFRLLHCDPERDRRPHRDAADHQRAGLAVDRGQDVVRHHREVERSRGSEGGAAVAAAFDGDPTPAGIVGEDLRHLRLVAPEAVLEEHDRARAAGDHPQLRVAAAELGLGHQVSPFRNLATAVASAAARPCATIGPSKPVARSRATKSGKSTTPCPAVAKPPSAARSLACAIAT